MESKDQNKNLILGITKIGDLLLEQVISKNEEDKSLYSIVLRIPEYQRPYKWTAKNANQLLDDIEEAMNANKEIYRVGTLILHKNKDKQTDEAAKDITEEKTCDYFYDIVDGQQRIITFSLLLKSLGDNPAFLNQNLVNNKYNISNVLNNYRTLSRRIDKLHNDEGKNKLHEYVKNHCELLVVITEDLSEAFQFFDSQNARGKALYPHDLLKAYHLREMNNVEATETENVVKTWENLDQKELSVLFSEYLYRLKEWIKGNKANELTEQNIEVFKGVTARDNYPFAQYYKGAFAYADLINHSHVPFVTGEQNLRPFQINAPIIAGKAFFEYAKYYFDILKDIQDNSKYEGYFINGNEIVKTLDLGKYKNGTGNRITRLLFDTAILLYVDRFCPDRPSKTDLDYLEQFVVCAFVWAYSMRAQYKNVGWLVAQNYVMGTVNNKDVINGFNIFKTISDSDSPGVLLSKLADELQPLNKSKIKSEAYTDKTKNEEVNYEKKTEDGIYQYYHHFFKVHRFLEDN